MNTITQLQTWLDSRKADCQAAEQALAADAREDEAVFAKIQGNVFDIFSTVLQVAGRTQGNEAAALQFFRKKLEEIPANWRTALERAEANNDPERAHTERLKLEAVSRIRAAMEED
ncbi:MAG: hypothetical protein IJ357_08555 [Oscillospiraceae bacterium]|nr:hypothetical protein [Oscillospiraceae bacterium]